jgi:hypothetical protein
MNCLCCKAEIFSLPGRRAKRFCSKSCCKKYKYNCRKSPTSCMPVICKGCQKEFLPKKSDRRYCSRQCSFEHARRIKDEKDALVRIQSKNKPVIKHCAGCGVRFSGFRYRRFCSAKCSYLGSQARSWGKANQILIDCLECCRRVWIVSLDGTQERRVYCSAECCKKANKRTSKARRKQRLKDSGEVQRISLMRIAMRDGWTCQICGTRVSKGKRVPHPKAATLDHIIPVALGGPHTKENVQLAHFECNWKKRDVGLGDQLLLIG